MDALSKCRYLNFSSDIADFQDNKEYKNQEYNIDILI